MGGLGPGIGGAEYLIIAIVALLVVGPERLPLLLRKLGKLIGKARGMANEFRSSFDEMARQSELDELRKEVEALRTGQGMVPLGAEADAAFRDIRNDLNRPLYEPAGQPALGGPDEWPDAAPATAPADPDEEPKTTPQAKPGPGPRTKSKVVGKAAAAKPAAAKPGPAKIKTAAGKARPTRAKKVDL